MVLTLCVTLGGTSRKDAGAEWIVQLASLALIGYFAWRGALVRTGGGISTAWALLGAGLVLVLLQIISLPPDWWVHLPGRQQFAKTYEDAGIPLPWLPISLDRSATIRSASSLLPGVALFTAALALDTGGRRRLTLVLIALCGMSLLLGIAQVSDGPDSPLRPFELTNESSAVGFFANANHFGSFLLSALPLTAAWCIWVLATQRRGAVIQLLSCLGFAIALLIGVASSGSRAGVYLGAFASFACVAMVWVSARGEINVRSRRSVLAGAVVIVTGAFLLLFGFAPEVSVVDNLRLELVRTTLTAVRAFDPVGTGLGTFQPIYAMFEQHVIPNTYVNHAHNDWVELWLEAGWPGLALMVGFLIWYAWQCKRAWWPLSQDATVSDVALARAATVILALQLIHSAVDYPLRTAAHIGLFAIACALLVAPQLDTRRGNFGGRVS